MRVISSMAGPEACETDDSVVQQAANRLLLTQGPYFGTDVVPGKLMIMEL